jgi:hypothetical protein
LTRANWADPKEAHFAYTKRDRHSANDGVVKQISELGGYVTNEVTLCTHVWLGKLRNVRGNIPFERIPITLESADHATFVTTKLRNRLKAFSLR